ncbi:MAG: hypothetical protein Q4D13_01945 [Erysipelotrichaceae bacterium]|nr:hypothetical protein [Erysipelotrichaceae bacterium]
MNKKGFLLLDSLLCVFIGVNMCLLCFSIYRIINSDIDVNRRYNERENDFYYELFNSFEYCERCVINEPDEESIGTDDYSDDA